MTKRSTGGKKRERLGKSNEEKQKGIERERERDRGSKTREIEITANWHFLQSGLAELYV